MTKYFYTQNIMQETFLHGVRTDNGMPELTQRRRSARLVPLKLRFIEGIVGEKYRQFSSANR